MARKTTGKTKAEIIAEQVAEAVGAGKKLKLESVDFSDPNRPKTCLEVDFPILPINQIAQIEGNAGKPIYQMSKWWARRRSSVFRSTLLAAATKAPDDPLEASKKVLDSYYGNHQDNETFRQLKVADIFMGGGTTLVEGSRLGMQMFGNDLSPVAWLVVKNELADVDIDEVHKLFDHIEQEVKPQIMPFYACDGPNGEKGQWTHNPTGKVMPEDFDPLTLKPEERKDYSYEGPEIIYTFWAKHGPCIAPGCGHRTPLMSSPVVAIKTLTVKSWQDYECQCGSHFDIERDDIRMAPGVLQVIADTEKPFIVMDNQGHFTCPSCKITKQDLDAFTKGKSASLGSSKNKKVEMHLLVHPDWLKGTSGVNDNGDILGGGSTDSTDDTVAWNNQRAGQLNLIEIRGKLPEAITCPMTGNLIKTDIKTITKAAHFACQADTCGREQRIAKATESYGTTAPASIFMHHCYSPERKKNGAAYGGRYFMPAGSSAKLNSAIIEWNKRKNEDLKPYWPKSEVPFGHMTHQRQPLPQHGYTEWSHMFNPLQMLVLAQLLKAIDTSFGFSQTSKDFVVGVFQQYLRNQYFGHFHAAIAP